MVEDGTDVCTLIVTRCSHRTGSYYAKVARAQLGRGSRVVLSTPPLSDGEVLGMIKGQVGGIMQIIGIRWGPLVYDTCRDRSGLGLVTATYLRGGTMDIQLLGTYWPVKSIKDQGRSLWTRTKR